MLLRLKSLWRINWFGDTFSIVKIYYFVYLFFVKKNSYDVIIVGGGLAGLTAAIHLSLENHSVLVLEKQPYPHHKVCGEYVSYEVAPYLEKLGVNLIEHGAVFIDTFQLSTVSGNLLEVGLPQGGYGISRYAFDDILYKRASECGVDFVFRNVTSVSFQNNDFEVFISSIESYTSSIVVGAYGKRTVLDKQLKRKFIQQKSSWLGVKCHYRIDDFPDNLVALHNFNGGYGGLSKTETGDVNFCYLASYDSFKSFKNVTEFNKHVVSRNLYISKFLDNAIPIFEKPLSIAQISFHEKKPVEEHVIMCGDTAGLIHPLCGNGMAMAIHSAKIASDLIAEFFSNKTFSRKQLEKEYTKSWGTVFKKRLWMGRQFQRLMLNAKMFNLLLVIVGKSPRLLKFLIKQTHGKPLVC